MSTGTSVKVRRNAEEKTSDTQMWAALSAALLREKQLESDKPLCQLPLVGSWRHLGDL